MLPSSKNLKNYAGKGITVCERWLTFDNFLADMGPRPSLGHSLDRYPDANGNYEPGNVRWATRAQQSRNKSTNHNVTIKGVTKCLKDWAAEAGINYETVRARLRRNWHVEDAIFYPPIPKSVNRWNATWRNEVRIVSE
jgi:hypothetical protein